MWQSDDDDGDDDDEDDDEDEEQFSALPLTAVVGFADSSPMWQSDEIKYSNSVASVDCSVNHQLF